ncbi:general stress protein [Saccharibacillus sp. CPCC 101409]|uniref:general stress protein n=1 Tax=Saccharibacillus sp. CPCC 101409 TaxID=3058041 RepID=UPI0026725AC3|nr:general stress protein [Saccharibacillus sp. CPCC 101409]MDO3409300.1 general stress protein [Saccharibacillus sp. CPCC 101409]
MTNRTIVGVFPTEQAALDAIHQLKAKGVGSDQITVIGRDPHHIEEISQDTNLKSAEANTQPEESKGFLNSIRDTFSESGDSEFTNVGPYVAAGPLAHKFIGSDTYSGGHGWRDDFANLGFSEAEAEKYDKAVQEGSLLLLLEESSGELGEIRSILGTTANTSE